MFLGWRCGRRHALAPASVLGGPCPGPVQAGDEALLEKWLVTEGDRVDAGQVLAKGSLLHENFDVQAPDAGIVEQIAVAAGERFGQDYILARLASF